MHPPPPPPGSRALASVSCMKNLQQLCRKVLCSAAPMHAPLSSLERAQTPPYVKKPAALNSSSCVTISQSSSARPMSSTMPVINPRPHAALPSVINLHLHTCHTKRHICHPFKHLSSKKKPYIPLPGQCQYDACDQAKAASCTALSHKLAPAHHHHGTCTGCHDLCTLPPIAMNAINRSGSCTYCSRRWLLRLQMLRSCYSDAAIPSSCRPRRWSHKDRGTGTLLGCVQSWTTKLCMLLLLLLLDGSVRLTCVTADALRDSMTAPAPPAHLHTVAKGPLREAARCV